ncbi:MAG: aquaporin [Firmicutes bacterium]|nr:aquaporin [Bacillota bacterium]
MKKYISELIGTFALVFIGSGTYILAGNMVGQLGVAIAYGLAIIGIYSAIGRVSGGHINPAVTLGALVTKRITPIDSIFYIVAQFVGATLGAIAVWLIAIGNADYKLSYGLGQNGIGSHTLGSYTITSAIIFELIATFLFVYIFLSATSSFLNGAEGKKTRHNAGLGIGVFFASAYLMGLQVSGASLNPARSFGPAFIVGFVERYAWQELWIFIVFPVIGGLLAGLVYNLLHNKSDNDEIDVDIVEIDVVEE